MNRKLFLPCGVLAVGAAVLGAGSALGQAGKPPVKLPVAKPAPKPAPAATAPKPVAPAATPGAGITAATLGPALTKLGLEPKTEGDFQRVKIEEESFGYSIDFSVTRSGEWLIGVAHLAPIPDLTKVPSAPLLSLLSANDTLLGMYFSYDRNRSQIVLNAAVPARATRPEDLKGILEGMRVTIKETQGLWDPAAW